MNKPLSILIISASVREGRLSHRVALFFQRYLKSYGFSGEVSIADLKEYAFPVFEERLRYLKHPPQQLLDFAGRVDRADGIIIVTPEYNGGYPAALKNAVDVLYQEWRRKPLAIATVSDGVFGGTQVVTSLLFSFWKIGALLVPARFHAANVEQAYGEDGEPADPAATGKAAGHFVSELLWCMGRK